jgi:hypothetical protein
MSDEREWPGLFFTARKVPQPTKRAPSKLVSKKM